MSAVSMPRAVPTLLERVFLRIADATAAGIRGRVERRAERHREQIDRIRDCQAHGGYVVAGADCSRWLIDTGIR